MDIENTDIEIIKVEDKDKQIEENEIQDKQIEENETQDKEISEQKIPKRVFIIPYRGRPEQKYFFCKYMTFLLDNSDKEGENKEKDYEIYFSHQYDNRSFNRGATKNIGFLAIKEKYPDDYQNITFIFNDIDTVPFHNIFTYDTTPGIVKHYYGFEYALGGIVVIKGGDFELINGYPCLWGWGMEDTVLQRRCLDAGIQIDRSEFYPIGSPEILQLFDGVDRLMNKRDPKNLYYDDGEDGISTLKQLFYTVDKQSKNESDNIYLTDNNSQIFIVNIYSFLTRTRYKQDDIVKYDMRRPLRSMKDMEQMATEQKQKFHLKNSIKEPRSIYRDFPPSKQVVQQSLMSGLPKRVTFTEQTQSSQLNQEDFIKKQQQVYKQMQQVSIQNKQNIPSNYYNSASYIFSPQYAQQVGQKPRASTSANIGLGGIVGLKTNIRR